MQVKRMAQLCAFLSLTATAWSQLVPAQPPTVIKTETKLVLVDVVVSNKKGQYVDDLAIKNFRVWDDNKEQTLKSFSYGPDPASPDAGKRYIVLFFDSNTLGANELVQARIAAQKFIESNAGPDRLIAVASFFGAVQIAQNFTPDIDKLKNSLGKVRATAVNRGPDVAMLGGVRTDPTEEFNSRAMLQGLRGLAKNLGHIPGRKSLVLFTSGFPLTNNNRDEANATINACNQSNVAVYAVDSRGVAGNMLSAPTGIRGGRAVLETPGPAHVKGIALAAWPVSRIASVLLEPQVGGGRGGGGAGSASPTGGSGGMGGGTASPGGTGGTPGGNPGMGNPGGNPGMGNPGTNSPGRNNPGMNNPGINNGGVGNDPFNRTNDPRNTRNNPFGLDVPSGAINRQQILYMLAEGTGGFVILNTNDLATGLDKIAKEQNSYYILGYTPVETPEGSCHTLKVKVDRGGINVRSRAGYCNARSKDVLAGNPIEKTLESRVTGSAKGSVAASMSVPFFYTGPDIARVAVTLEIPTETVKFEKIKGKQHAAINVLGIAYNQDGSVAARFSDVVKFDFENAKEVDHFREKPLHYENQFDIAAGTYAFKAVFDTGGEKGGENFGKLESPLVIQRYDPAKFAISGVALCKGFGPANTVDAGMDSLLMEGRAPLIAGNFKFSPSGYSRFKQSENVAMYFEVYDPLVAGDTPPKIAVQMRFLDAAGKAVTDSGVVPVDSFVHAGDPKVPAGLKLPVSVLPPGAYKLELTAQDSAGNSAVRIAEFEVM